MSIHRTVVLERRTLFRQGLVALLRAEPDFEVAGEAATPEEALRLCMRERPHLILLDESLVGESLERERTTMAAIAGHCPEAAIVVLGRAGDTEGADCASTERQRVLQEGAAAYLCATADHSELVRTLREAARSRIPTEGLPPALPGRCLATTLHPLSAREMAVLTHIAEGLCNKEIAQRLGISTQTVKNHVSHLLEKLALADRTQLALYAIERRYVAAASKAAEAL